MGVELFLSAFVAILSQYIVTVRTQNLGNGELAKLKVDKVLEACLSLELESRITFEALLDNVKMFFEKFQNFLDYLSFDNDFFNSHLGNWFALNIIEQSLTLFLDEVSVHVTDRLDMIRFLFVKRVE